MNFNYKYYVNLLFIFVLFSGCASLKNVTANEVRSDRYFYKKFFIEKTIKEINKSLYDYSNNCHSLGSINVNPNNHHEATMQMSIPGLTDTSVIVVMDFVEINGITKVYTYHYYPAWKKHIEKVISAINSPNLCK